MQYKLSVSPNVRFQPTLQLPLMTTTTTVSILFLFVFAVCCCCCRQYHQSLCECLCSKTEVLVIVQVKSKKTSENIELLKNINKTLQILPFILCLCLSVCVCMQQFSVIRVAVDKTRGDKFANSSRQTDRRLVHSIFIYVCVDIDF